MNTKPNSAAGSGCSSHDLFAVGDWVKINPDSEYEYEVAEIRRFPHGIMVGIYDEPPTKHVDFWNVSTLVLSRRDGVCRCGARRLDSGCYTSEPCDDCFPANSKDIPHAVSESSDCSKSE